MEKLKMHSPDMVENNITKLAELFPNCVTEIADEKGNIKKSIDFDLLRQELSGTIVEGPQERYHLNWPGETGSAADRQCTHCQDLETLPRRECGL